MRTVATQTGCFMNSGKIGGWRSKLTILQGRFLMEKKFKNFETNIQIYHKHTFFKSLKAQELYAKCQAELSEYEELPNIMEYGKRPFQI